MLGRRGGVLMGEAGAALDLGMPGVSGLADRMIEAGLIEKRRRNRNRRALVASLQAKFPKGEDE